MKNWDHSIHQYVLVYQGKDLRIILLYFCRSNKKIYGFCLFGGGHPVFMYKHDWYFSLVTAWLFTTGSIIVWVHLKRSGAEWRMWSQSTESRSSDRLNTSQGLQKTGESEQLSNGFRKTTDDLLEDLHHNGKMKLSCVSVQYRKEGRDQGWNKNALVLPMCKIPVCQANKGIYIYIYIYITEVTKKLGLCACFSSLIEMVVDFV